MNRWKVAAYVLVLVCLVLAVAMLASVLKLKQYEGVIDKYAAGELTRQHFVPGQFKEIPATVPGATPILTVHGTVRYPPTPGASRVVGTEAAPLASPTPGGSGTITDGPGQPEVTTSGCELSSLDVSIRCQVDAVATPSRPWAKLIVSGTIRDGERVRELPPIPAGDVALTVSPAVNLHPLPWELRVGVGTGLTARLGATYMPWRRVGVWADVAAPVTSQGQVEAGAGVSFRF